MVGNDTIVEMMEAALRRYCFMECLDDGSKDKRTLVADLDCSRSTVNRGIRELESLDLVEYVDGGYRLSSLGELVAADFAELAETIELRLQFQPFLKWMPEDAFDLELDLLRDAELLLPKPGDPYAMVNRHVAGLEHADRFLGILPVTGLHAYKMLRTRVVENGAWVEAVVTPEVSNTLQSDPDYAGLTEDMSETGRYKLYRYDGDIQYFIGLLNDTVQIGVDEAGEPRALVETTNPKVRDWAETTFEEYKKQAEPVITSPERTKVQT